MAKSNDVPGPLDVTTFPDTTTFDVFYKTKMFNNIFISFLN